MTSELPWFMYCPKCGAASPNYDGSKKIHCGHCAHVFFQNPAASASIVMKCGDEFLFSVRKRDPSRGKLDFPGGFVDPGESLEQAVEREIWEELTIEVDKPHYLFSFANTYLYRDVLYQTCDTFFLVGVESKPKITCRDDVQGVCWARLADILDADLAFDSMRAAVSQLRAMSEGSLLNFRDIELS